MAGNREGGAKAALTMKNKYGTDFFKSIGSKGGSAKVPKGFAVNLDLASEAGRKGGLKSKRGKAKVENEQDNTN